MLKGMALKDEAAWYCILFVHLCSQVNIINFLYVDARYLYFKLSSFTYTYIVFSNSCYILQYHHINSFNFSDHSLL